MSALGQAIRARRRELDLTQAELSKATGLAGSHICQIETGKSMPSVEALQVIAKALNVPSGNFMAAMTSKSDAGLLDKFAGQAMQSLILRLAGGPGIGNDHDGLLTHLAGEAFAMAKAMMKVRAEAAEPGGAA